MGGEKFNLTHQIIDKKFYHLGLSQTSLYWPFLQEEYRNPQRFRGTFISHQLEAITAYNQHNSLLGPFQYCVTASISTVILTGRKTSSGKYPSGIWIWGWKTFRGQGVESLWIAYFYRPAPTAQGAGQESVYSQHPTQFHNYGIRISPYNVS